MLLNLIVNNYNLNNNKITFKARPTNILSLESPIIKGKPKIAFSWSGGKDSTIAIFEILKSGKFDIVSLFTAISSRFRRVSLSSIREELVENQAKSIGIPLKKVIIGDETYEGYVKAMNRTFGDYKNEGVNIVAYGDITTFDRFDDPNCLSTIRAGQLNGLEMKALFPLTMGTEQSLDLFIRNGFKSVVTCIDSIKLDKSFLGSTIDRGFLKRLPKNVDPSGEHGEYHSFSFDGPIFKSKINFSVGEHRQVGQNIFCDLIP
jgi:uncharacterized protein (TIGR00290 family)